MDARFRIEKGSALIACSLLILMLAVSACTPDPLELEGLQSAKSEIVVSSQILPDGALAVFLTRTFNSLEAQGNQTGSIENLAIEDAVVTVSTGNTVYSLQHVEHGVYAGVKLPFKVGHEYILSVNSRSMGKVTAKTKLQPGVVFDTVTSKLYWQNEDEPFAEVNYKITDPKEKNFYMVNVQASKKQDVYSNLINPDVYTRIMDDENFNGNKFTETFKATNKKYYPGDSIAVTVTAISEDYYQYLKMRVNNTNELIEMFSEPVHYPSNVKGGRGFFNLHSPDGRVLLLK
jgi:hypothetical protein